MVVIDSCISPIRKSNDQRFNLKEKSMKISNRFNTAVVGGCVFLAQASLAGAAVLQDPITLIPVEQNAKAEAVSSNKRDVELFRQIVLAEKPTAAFECRSENYDIKVTARGYLNLSCSNALSETFQKQSPDHWYELCLTQGDMKNAVVASQVTIKDGHGKVIYDQPYNEVAKETLNVSPPQTYFSYGYGTDSVSSFPVTNDVGNAAIPKLGLEYAATLPGKGLVGIFDQDIPLSDSYPALDRLNIYLDSDRSMFTGPHAQDCQSSDQGLTSKRFTIDLASGTATITSNVSVLNPNIQELTDGALYFPRTIGYGFGTYVFPQGDVNNKICYNTLTEMKQDLVQVQNMPETMVCTGIAQ
jgi:hypothetical protein